VPLDGGRRGGKTTGREERDGGGTAVTRARGLYRKGSRLRVVAGGPVREYLNFVTGERLEACGSGSGSGRSIRPWAYAETQALKLSVYDHLKLGSEVVMC